MRTALDISMLEEIRQSQSNRAKHRANCPFCYEVRGKEDKKFALEFNTVTKQFKCYKCETAGPLLGYGDSFAPLILDTSKLIERVSNLFKDREESIVNLDLFSSNIQAGMPSHKYLMSRGFSDADIQSYKIRSGNSYTVRDKKVTKWNGRVVFPFYDEGIPKYAVGRSYNGKDPKYVNTDSSKSCIVYGIDLVDGVCIICEGIISAIKAAKYSGVPAVALLGKTISDFQVYRIASKTKKVFVSLDGGVSEHAVNDICSKFKDTGIDVFKVSLPEPYDPDELGEEYNNYFEKATRYKNTMGHLGGLV